MEKLVKILQVNFRLLNSNITGGADLESLESIKYGIPSLTIL